MNIHSISYKDKAAEWELEPIAFKRLTLMVGASGAGKTRILKAILDLKRIAQGAPLNGVEWNIKCSTQKGHSYEWEGCFENNGLFQPSFFGHSIDEKGLPDIKYERLLINGELVIDRTEARILFNKAKTVKLSSKKSAISLLKEEEQIKDLYNGFGQILFDDNSPGAIDHANVIGLKPKKYTELEDIRNSDEGIHIKLYLTYVNIRKVFDEIKESFIEIFPYVEDVKIEAVSVGDKKSSIFFQTLSVQIREKGVNNWIDESKISSGMIRILMQIAKLYLCAEGSVILVDEFENSLGVNCIDEITSSIISHRRNLQFIITSHHPYIINNINFNNWKLITRKGGIVKSYDMTDFNFGQSKHKAFTQLLNLDKYVEGVEL